MSHSPGESSDASRTVPTTPGELGSETGRGRHAQSPTQIPWCGWKDVVWRVSNEVGRDNVLDVAASVAFYGLLALYPALLATISMYGLLSDPTDVIRQVNQLSIALPAGARSAVMNQMRDIARTSPTGLGLGLLLSLGVAFLSASSGVAALMRGISAVYDERDTRGWVRVRLIALSFTMSLSLFVILSVSTITLLPSVVERVGLGRAPLVLVRFARWPTLALAAVACLAILYRHAPNRTPARWKWVAPGAILATLIWTVGSFSFGIYVENFGRFNRTYGTIGAAVVLSLWMYMSALAILLGAELNAELERQTEVDSTIGPPRPMGERAASVADNLGPPRPQPPARGIKQTLTDTVSDLSRPGKRKGSS
jgi:membrane protein